MDREHGAPRKKALLSQLGLTKPKIGDLQALPVEKIMSAYFAALEQLRRENFAVRPFAPTVDGKIVTQHPFTPTASRVAPDVPVIFSHTSGEATFQAADRLFDLDEAAMRTEPRRASATRPTR